MKILYSSCALRLKTESGTRHWQAHISQAPSGEWVGWASRGEGDNPRSECAEISRSLDIWTVAEALNERMDGRAQRGYNALDPQMVAWIDNDLVNVLASQGISIEAAPEAGPNLLPLDHVAAPDDNVHQSPSAGRRPNL